LHISSATGSASPTPTELRIATTTSASDWSTTDPWGRISFFSADASNNGPKTHATIDSVAQGVAGGHSSLRFSIADLTTTLYEGLRFECTGSTGQTFTSFSTSGSERLRITNTGDVGIGTTSPSRLLTVANAVNTDATIKNVAYFCGNYAGNVGSGARILIGGDTPSSTDRGVALVGVNSGGENNAHDMVFEVSASSSAPTERARIDSSGRLLVGTSSAYVVPNYAGTSIKPQLQTSATTIAGGAYANIGWYVGASNGPNYVFARSNSDTPGTYTAVSASSSLGSISFAGSDGSAFVTAASISSQCDGTPGTGDMPGRIVLSTTADGASSPTEEWRITNEGVVCYNQAELISKAAAATLTVTELKTGIIRYTGTAATLTLPTGTLTEGGFSGIYTNMTFEWSVINTGSGLCTIGAGTAHTIVGGATIAAGASGRFASRRTAANTFVTYRLS
jgi:hypothetical protein